jgi:protein-tyrosine phosphatase
MSERLRTVIFVCTANFYRSRFSEYLFNYLAERQGLGWQATSRGLQTWMVDGEGPISEFTIDRLREQGIPLDAERFPIPLSEADLESADLVVAVKEAEHRPMMRQQFPAWEDRIQYWHVDDLDCATPDEALPVCQKCVQSLVERLAAAEHQRKKVARHAAA